MSNADKRHLWKSRIQKQQESGLPIKQWCQDNQVNIGCFGYWKKKLSPVTCPNRDSFIELTDEQSCTIDVNYSTVRLRLESPSLKHSLELLKKLAC